MKTIFLIAILLISFLTFETNAQENIKGDSIKEERKNPWWENQNLKGNLLRDEVPEEIQLLAAKCNRKLEACSQTLPLYSLRDWGDFMFAKGEGFFCLILYYILPKHANSPGNLNIFLKNGEIIKLNICDSIMVYKGGEKVSSNFFYVNNYNPNSKLEEPTLQSQTVTVTTGRGYYCLYEITEKDVQIFTENIVDKVNLYYTPIKTSEDSKVKKNATGYLEYKIWKMFSDRYYKIAAQSILSK